MVVLALLLRRHLAKRLPGARDQEDRVIAETGLAPPLRHHLAAALALEQARVLAGHRQRDDADKPRRPWTRHAFQSPEQLCGPLLLRRSKSRRPDAGKSAERVNFKARVVTQRWEPGL